MILILTEKIDVHADRVEAMLRARGVDLVRFDTTEFPTKAEISLRYSTQGRIDCLLHTAGRTLDLTAVNVIWNRRPRRPVAPADLTDERCRAYVKDECEAVLDNVWDVLPCRWLPSAPGPLQRAESKFWQLQLAGEIGFELPPTLISTSTEDVLEFYQEHQGKIVSKLPGLTFFNHMGSAQGQMFRFTDIVSRRDLGYLSAVRYAPMIFQAYVPKRVELRITVVGHKIFAAEIHSQQTKHTQHDWRHYDFRETPYLPHELPAEVAEHCLELVRRMGLCYGAIDMVITPDGRYVFLEINPNGQYLWIEEETGLPISEAICEALVGGEW